MQGIILGDPILFNLLPEGAPLTKLQDDESAFFRVNGLDELDDVRMGMLLHNLQDLDLIHENLTLLLGALAIEHLDCHWNLLFWNQPLIDSGEPSLSQFPLLVHQSLGRDLLNPKILHFIISIVIFINNLEAR